MCARVSNWETVLIATDRRLQVLTKERLNQRAKDQRTRIKSHLTAEKEVCSGTWQTKKDQSLPKKE